MYVQVSFCMVLCLVGVPTMYCILPVYSNTVILYTVIVKAIEINVGTQSMYSYRKRTIKARLLATKKH